MKKITVSDITLRAVEQLNKELTFRDKLSIAEMLDASNVDAIELPALNASKENQVIYRTIASTVKHARVKIPVGFSASSVRSAFDCIKGAKNACLQVALPVSTAQMEYFYHLKAPVMQEKIGELVKLSKEFCLNVEFVAYDAFRAEEGFVEACAKTAFDNGATAITLCDDAGVAFYNDYEIIVKKIKAICDIDVFVQPSNALSLASASAIVAISSGADGVKTSAIGTYLSIDVLADVMRAKSNELGVTCNVDVTCVKSIVAKINGVTEDNQNIPQTNIAGNVNSFATAHDIADIIKQLGYELSDDDNGKVYEEFKKLTAKKEVIDTKELEAIVASTAMQVPSTYHLVNYVVNSGNIIPATANVTLEKDGEKFTGVSTGDGPIDAAFHAIEQIIGHHYDLDDFQVHAVTKGRGAVGSSIIRLRADGKLYPGNGVSTDIVGACIRAYINALNKIVYGEN